MIQKRYVPRNNVPVKRNVLWETGVLVNRHKNPEATESVSDRLLQTWPF